jgi:alginate O-acetyltransferase complex protein AlgI
VLFNSVEFIFAFLPVVFALATLASRAGPARLVRDILLAASLIFYAWWDVSRLPLLLGTVCFNHLLALIIGIRPALRSICLSAGVVLNIGLLAYFKYRGFVLGEVLGFPGVTSATDSLPLGISFFTFQQLAWLFDAARPGAEKTSLSIYALFVTFFPQLIAGPIVHHNELVPQLMSPRIGRAPPPMIAAGFSLFAIGLFKKVVVADHFAPVADAAFAATTTTTSQLLECGQAWVGLASYACQIYFDFSGYSDMALGLGMLFGVILPINFYSPYKSLDVAEFWRRWHITLSRFLRDFVYIPLGGNRVGNARQSLNLFITMVVGGIWHGAGYTFLLWGFLHGLLLAVVHMHRTAIRQRLRWWPRLGRAAWALTLLSVVLAWVPFRATSLTATVGMYRSLCPPAAVLVDVMAGGEAAQPSQLRLAAIGNAASLAVLLGLVVCLLMPATAEMFHEFLGDSGLQTKSRPWLVDRMAWKPSCFWAITTAVIFFLAVMDLLSAAPSAFLYFQF